MAVRTVRDGFLLRNTKGDDGGATATKDTVGDVGRRARSDWAKQPRGNEICS